MTTVNQYHVSHILGSKMKVAPRGRFGNLGVTETTAELLKARLSDDNTGKVDHGDDHLIVLAFEEVRDGAAPDWILWDKQLAGRFSRRCRELGVLASSAALNRRLLSIRKNPSRYAKHGVTIAPTPAKVPHDTIVHRHATAIEFALVKLHYRYGASIDDILLDPQLADEFEIIVRSIVDGLTSAEMRRAALYMRKTRHFKKDEQLIVKKLDTNEIESQFKYLGTMADVDPEPLPHDLGLVEVRETDRSLYIAVNEDLHGIVEEFVAGKVFRVVSNEFWTPDSTSIDLRIVSLSEFNGVDIRTWGKALIHYRSPVFNLPIAA